MRWRKRTADEWVTDRKTPQRWFAWYPVRLRDELGDDLGEIAWLEFVRRAGVPPRRIPWSRWTWRYFPLEIEG